jgi:adenine phosphoribosyltransferase
MQLDQIEKMILEVPNFPKAGIQFKDITPILADGRAFQALIDHMAERIDHRTQKIVAIESRGFILGSALALKLGCGLVVVRKPGKLPRATLRETYELEYGSDALEIHHDAIRKGESITIVDDVLATGGTASAAERLCEKIGAHVLGSVFLIELQFLKGRSKLKSPAAALYSN